MQTMKSTSKFLGMSIFSIFLSIFVAFGVSSQTTTSSTIKSTKNLKLDPGFQKYRTMVKFYKGKSVIPVNNGLAFYFDKNGVLHTKQMYHNKGPKNASQHAEYTPGKGKKGKRPAVTRNGVQIPKADAICIPENYYFPKKDPNRICVTLFLTVDGDVYSPENDTYMLVSDGPSAFQAAVHHEAKLRNIPKPVPSYYGNIRKYGGVGIIYKKYFPNDLVAQKIDADLKLHVAKAKQKSTAELNAELAALNAKWDAKWAREDRLKAEAAKREAAKKRKAANARRAEREKRCKKQTGKACSSNSGGLFGWMLGGIANAYNSGGSSQSSSPSVSYEACTSGDTCFRFVRQNGKTARIQCTKGIYKGQEQCIMVNKKGKWASGCGISDSAAHHYNTMKRAGNIACGL